MVQPLQKYIINNLKLVETCVSVFDVLCLGLDPANFLNAVIRTSFTEQAQYIK